MRGWLAIFKKTTSQTWNYRSNFKASKYFLVGTVRKPGDYLSYTFKDMESRSIADRPQFKKNISRGLRLHLISSLLVICLISWWITALTSVCAIMADWSRNVFQSYSNLPSTFSTNCKASLRSQFQWRIWNTNTQGRYLKPEPESWKSRTPWRWKPIISWDWTSKLAHIWDTCARIILVDLPLKGEIKTQGFTVYFAITSMLSWK